MRSDFDFRASSNLMKHIINYGILSWVAIDMGHMVYNNEK